MCVCVHNIYKKYWVLIFFSFNKRVEGNACVVCSVKCGVWSGCNVSRVEMTGTCRF